MSIYEVSHGNAYANDPQFDNMSGRIVHQSEIVGMTLDGWKVRHIVQVIDIGRAADIDPVDPDAQMQGEKLWSQMIGNQNARAANLAAGEERRARLRQRMIDYMTEHGPSTSREMETEFGVARDAVGGQLRLDEGVHFVRVGKMSMGRGGMIVIWGLKEGHE